MHICVGAGVFACFRVCVSVCVSVCACAHVCLCFVTVRFVVWCHVALRCVALGWVGGIKKFGASQVRNLGVDRR